MARCIGIFDSGVGGLTVVRAVRARLPYADVVYLGDTARLPYGNKSPRTVEKYALACQRFLLDAGAEVVLIACNTASAHARSALAAASPVPVIDAITTGAARALAVSRNRHIGVLATRGTVASNAYQQIIKAQAPDATVRAVASPLLVPLAEEGWLDGPVPDAVARSYLEALAKELADMDTLILGCTHYPLLAPLLGRVAEQVWARPIELVDGALAMAEQAAALLPDLERPASRAGSLRLYATDATRLDELAKLFLGQVPSAFEIVDL